MRYLIDAAPGTIQKAHASLRRQGRSYILGLILFASLAIGVYLFGRSDDPAAAAIISLVFSFVALLCLIRGCQYLNQANSLEVAYLISITPKPGTY